MGRAVACVAPESTSGGEIWSKTKMQGHVSGAGATLLTRLQGAWLLTREIEDHLAGTAGRFEGQAEFREDGGGLRYREAGWLHLSGQRPLRAERVYLWRADGEWVEVLFEDGRLFHRFVAAAQAASAHACATDSYAVTYAFDWARGWQAVWDVSGPRKHYRMISTYRRG